MIGKVRTKEELVKMQVYLREEWDKALENREGNLSKWIAFAYSQSTIDYVLGKLKNPPVLNLLKGTDVTEVPKGGVITNAKN